MAYKWSLSVLALALAVLSVLALSGGSPLWICVSAIVAFISLAVSTYSVVKPLDAVQNGIYLLREQDFSSRLRRVGQPDADKVVDFFNRTMDVMKTERLKNQERGRFLQQLIDASPMGIAICRLDGEVDSVNDAYRTLVTPPVEADIASLGPGESRTLRPDATTVIRISRHWFMDCGFRRPFILVEQLTEDILRAEREVFSRTVRTMGHEVNNTLGSVMSVLEIIAASCAGDREMTDTVNSCYGRCSALASFVNNYSAIVKLPEPELESVNLNDYIEGLLPFLRGMAPGKVSVTTEFCTPAPLVCADPSQLERVLVNIAKNAFESMGQCGTLTIRTLPKTIIVSDTGSGISADNARRIFTPFFSTKPGGHGLGLMLVSEILRRHHASFSLSTVDGITSFTITFA